MTTTNLIIGAGGHGKVIADAMQCQNILVAGFLDDDPALTGQTVFNLPVLGQITTWQDFDPAGLVLGIGDNRVRRLVADKVEAQAVPNWIIVRHPQSIIAGTVQFGAGTVIMPGAVVNVDTVIGKHAIINTGSTIDHDCRIGNFVHIAPGVHIAGGVSIDDGVFLGIGSCVIPGCHIGRGAVIGAGACVIEDIPDNVIAKGVPARWE